jgi:hypothetical protein
MRVFTKLMMVLSLPAPVPVLVKTLPVRRNARDRQQLGKPSRLGKLRRTRPSRVD